MPSFESERLPKLFRMSLGPRERITIIAEDDEGAASGDLNKNLASPEELATIDKNFKLAESMGMNGTPSYVIGQQVIIGAVGADALKEKVS